MDRRLIDHFQASWARQRETRLHLPPSWLEDGTPPAERLSQVFDDVLERARARVAEQRRLLDEREPPRAS